ncbi:pentapeptide repeat-containing protein, partial [Actinomadura adrarensis]
MPAARKIATSRSLKEPSAPRLPRTLTPAADGDLDLTHDGKYLSLEYGTVRLTGTGIEDAEFERCRFKGTSFAGVSLERASFGDVEFAGCDLANLKLRNSRMAAGNVTNCRTTGLHVTEGTIRDVVFDGCRADLTGFRFCQLRDVVFRDCNLTEANFQNAELHNVRFEGCKLVAAQFSNATMKQVRFAGGNDLAGIAGVQSLSGAIVSSADAPGLLGALTSALGITIED